MAELDNLGVTIDCRAMRQVLTDMGICDKKINLARYQPIVLAKGTQILGYALSHKSGDAPKNLCSDEPRFFAGYVLANSQNVSLAGDGGGGLRFRRWPIDAGMQR